MKATNILALQRNLVIDVVQHAGNSCHSLTLFVFEQDAVSVRPQWCCLPCPLLSSYGLLGDLCPICLLVQATMLTVLLRPLFHVSTAVFRILRSPDFHCCSDLLFVLLSRPLVIQLSQPPLFVFVPLRIPASIALAGVGASLCRVTISASMSCEIKVRASVLRFLSRHDRNVKAMLILALVLLPLSTQTLCVRSTTLGKLTLDAAP